MKDFPALARKVHGKRLVYLDSAATTLKPRCVIDAVSRVYRHHAGAVHRGGHALGHEVTTRYEAARGEIASFLGASPDEIVLLRGTTEAINLVATCFARPRLSPGDSVVVSAAEHHANLLPWQRICAEVGATLIMAKDVAAAVERRTRVVAVAHVSNVLGTIAPLREIRRAARAVGAAVVVDGAQAAPHGLADVSECDFYAFSGHKVYGPSGTGVLYGRAEHLAEMDPWLLGGHIVEEVTETGATFRVAPARFEAGTPNIEGVIGLAAALRWLKKQRIDHRLLRRAVKGLRAMRGVRVLGSPQVGLVSFTVDGAHAHDVATWLDAHGIAVRAGGLCAQPLLRRLGVDAAVRCSFGVYNTEADVDALLEAVRGARGALAA